MAQVHTRCCRALQVRSLRSRVGSSCWIRSSSSSLGENNSKSSVEERGPFASRLKSRGILRVKGEDTFRFFQGLISNDLRRLQQEPPPSETALPTPNQPIARAGPLYACLLNPQGRFLYDIFIYKSPRSTDRLGRTGSAPGSNGDVSLLCDVDASTIDELLGHLNKHKLRANVNFEDVSRDLTVWQRYGGSLMQDNPKNKDAEVQHSGWGACSDAAAQTSAEGNSKGYSWFKDPRIAALGYRGIFPSDTIPPLVEAGKEVDEIYYLLMRLELGIPEGCSEIPKEKAIPLEYNLAWLSAFSFDKGCYVGQELIARTQHRGIIRKRIMPIKFVNEAGDDVEQKVVPGAEIVDTLTQKKVGDVTTVLGSIGLGLVRLEAALKDAAQLRVKDVDGVHVRIYKPEWWPADWAPDDLRHN